MINLFKFVNSRSNNEIENSYINVEIPQIEHPEKGVAEVREEVRELYGWQSPYDYYYGSREESGNSTADSSTVISMEEIENFGSDVETDGVERADRDNVPKYFWIDSISNWCYFKVTSYNPSFTKKYSWAPGWLRATLNWLTLGLTESIETISTEGWGSWWKIPIHLLTSEASAVTYYNLATVNWIAGGRDFAEKWNAVSIVFLLYNILTGSSNNQESDIDAERLEEMYTSDPGEILMPRAGIALYMWNGYKRTWVPLKSLIEAYDRYCKSFTDGYYEIYLAKQFIPSLKRVPQTRVEEFLDDFFETIPLTDANRIAFHDECIAHISDSSPTALSLILKRILSTDPNRDQYARQMARVMIVFTYGMDPYAFDFLTQRSPIDKKQVLGVDHGNSSIWGEWHYIENWTKWIPLSREACRLKQYAKSTFQLINRPYTYVAYDWRDHNGWIHKNIGHPCFFRGNDDQLWISYWMRWTTGNLSEHKESSLFTETTTMSGAYDISTDDIKNWDNIVDSMFEKHDDYGFDEWLMNGDYGIEYSKFTIREEEPTSIDSYEQSSLNPNKVPPVNSIDDISSARLKISLSPNNVVSRNNENSLISIAKKWK